MKKLLLCGSALMLSLGMCYSQGLTATQAVDDFATSTEYTDITWAEDGNFTLTRGSFVMDLGVTSLGGNGNGAYPNFSVTFGTPINCETNGNANITIDLENATSTNLVMKIEVEDGSGNKSDIEPNISDVTVGLGWGQDVPTGSGKYPRKANNGIVLAASARETHVIDLSSVSGALGGLTRTGWCPGAPGLDEPSCGPITSYTIDPSDIVRVIFTVNYGNDGDYKMSQGDGDHTADYIIAGMDVGPLTGNIKFHSFQIGGAVLGVNKATEIESSISVYPNPASSSLNVSFDSKSSSDVILSDLSGLTVYSATGNAGQNNISVNTSNLSAGMYILNVTTENGRVARKVTIK